MTPTLFDKYASLARGYCGRRQALAQATTIPHYVFNISPQTTAEAETDEVLGKTENYEYFACIISSRSGYEVLVSSPEPLMRETKPTSNAVIFTFRHLLAVPSLRGGRAVRRQ